MVGINNISGDFGACLAALNVYTANKMVIRHSPYSHKRCCLASQVSPLSSIGVFSIRKAPLTADHGSPRHLLAQRRGTPRVGDHFPLGRPLGPPQNSRCRWPNKLVSRFALIRATGWQ